MKLSFSLDPVILSARKGEISALVAREVPGSLVSFDDAAGGFTVTLPDGVNAAAAAEMICVALSANGIEVQPSAEKRAMPALPSFEEPRRGRTVSLSVYVTTVVAMLLILSTVLLYTFSSMSSGFLSYGSGLGTGGESEDYAGKIGLIDTLFDKYSLYDTNGELLLDEMLKSYVAATGDRYAKYYTDAEYTQMMEDNNGTVVGIGITALEDDETHAILVVEVIPTSPAAEAGLQPGDRIVAIGSGEQARKVSEIGYISAVSMLRGEVGSVAEFTALRGETETAYSITRAKVTRISVTGHALASDPTVGYLRITQFDTVTPTQFKKVMNELIAGGCTSFIYDVRNNPGGDVKSIKAVLSYFLNDGDLILSIIKKDSSSSTYKVGPVTYSGAYAACSVAASEIGMYRNYTHAVITNGYTASAAELFTAVLKDYSLATVVGETTIGKGILQTIYNLEKWGYSGAIKLTTGYYNPPSGVNYDGVGVLPHVEVKLSEAAANKSIYLLTEEEDDQLQEAVKALREAKETN